MKIVLISLFAIIAMTLTASAQSTRKVSFSEDANLSFGSKVFFVEPLSYMGYGWHMWDSKYLTKSDFAYCNEFFINIMELGVRPTKALMFTLGVDYDLDQYRPDNGHYWGATENSNVWRASSIASFNKLNYSRLNVHSFSMPLSVEIHAGKSAFRVGAAGEYNLPAVVKNKGVNTAGDTVKNKITGIVTRDFSYSFFASISYGGLGVYARYRPAFQFAEGEGPAIKTFTIGAIMGLGM